MGVFALRPVVLVVDDGAANGELIRMYLSTIDCEVRLAADGVAALAMIERVPRDRVFLDLRVPRSDGYELRRGVASTPLRKRLAAATLATPYPGGILHDIGKIGVPDAILHKPGPLDSIEVPQMQAHVAIGESIVKPLQSTSGLLPIIRHHHERFDGSGYPDGLRAREIPRAARIVSVCDAFDALVNDRPYRVRRRLEEHTS